MVTPSWDERIYIGDFNGDGKDDMLTTPDNRPPTNNQQHGNFHVYYNTSSGGNLSFSNPSVFWNCNTGCTAWGEDFYVGDFDGDGKDDFFVVADPTTGILSWNGLELYSSNGTGFTYKGNLTCSGGGCTPSWGEQFYIGDFDNDGKDDFIVNADMHNNVNWQGYKIFMNKTSSGNYTFQDKGLEGANGYCTFPSWGERFHTGDYNGDGYSDFIVTADKTLNIDWDGWLMFHSRGNTGAWKPSKNKDTDIGTIAVNNKTIVKGDEGIFVYPNPANEILTFKNTKTGKQISNVTIKSVDGRTVSVNKLNTTPDKQLIELDIANLQSGVYIYSVDSGTETINGRFTKL